MFTALLASVVEFLIVVGLAALVYQIFLSDFIAAKRRNNQQHKTQTSNVAKMAKVKLVSDDIKDIEKFIANNAEHLSEEMVNLLVARIEAIKTDQIINADTILKTRIDSLDKNTHLGSSLDSLLQETGELEEVEAKAQKKSKRK